jgi:uncharacterized protein GlcG (DUF336 family)
MKRHPILRNLFVSVVVLLLSTLIAGQAFAAEKLPTAPYLPLSVAQKVANAAMDQCIKDGHRVSVAIIARSGETKVLLRADGASPHTVGSSTGKAFTSASMGQPTMKLANLIKDKPELEQLREMDDRMLILAGGLPIKIDGALVGGIGVGGAPGGHLDQACAQVGIDSLSK